MGESALKSNILSKWHNERSNSLSNIASLLNQDQFAPRGKNSNEPASKETTSNEPAKMKQSSLDQRFIKSALISAEIRWVLNVVTSKYSTNSSSNSGDLFFVVFPESDILKRFQCGRTKAGYVAYFGLAPYFHELMLPKLSDCPYFSLSFWQILKHFSSERSNGYHYSILGLGDKLCCHSLPRIGIHG